MLSIVGGVYRERCLHPDWDQVYGSAGRAASAVVRLGGHVEIHSHLDAVAREVLNSVDGLTIIGSPTPCITRFDYTHGLANPTIHRGGALVDLSIEADKVVRYGMLDATAKVTANYAVFDPQNVLDPESFRANGSTAEHLALVLNRFEAMTWLGRRDLSPSEMAGRLATQEGAEVVIIKMGPQGALVWFDGQSHQVPAYETPRVWKIGSGDQFVAIFAYAWMEEGRDPVHAADRASRATAFYCQHQGFPTLDELDAYRPEPVEVSERFRGGRRPRVYLAGPFFSLGQLWVVEQARNCLLEMGIKVFSPYHDVGLGRADEVVQQDIQGIHDCDLVLAIGDGMDPGTVFEIGYARSIGKPVVVYAETESVESAKMMVGTDCFMRDDFVSAIYQTVWIGAKL